MKQQIPPLRYLGKAQVKTKEVLFCLNVEGLIVILKHKVLSCVMIVEEVNP